MNINRYILIGLLFLSTTGFANLLLNPSFESWTNPRTPANWTVEDTIYAKVYKESTRVFHGSFAAKFQRFQAGTGNNKGVLQRVTLPGTGRYMASVRVWRTSDSANCGLTITWRRADQSFISSWTTTYADTYLPSWQVILRSGVNDTAPSEAVYADFIIRTYGRTGSPSGGTFVVDSVSFIRATGAFEENFSSPINIPLLEVNPNPFTHATSVNYILTSDGSHSIKVYDATGTVVRTLLPNRKDFDKWYTIWDGRNEKGEACPPGIYFIVLESADAQIKRAKAVLLR
ncbi:MAG: T9SS type A sorting domain-containing protein [candidate division WOR-3 bacterium]|nr:T9SS type A sorting domain-containing protein [candidate division WOR-3 bacterium]MDW7987621.1 T9SS type A sorting domain-containing protein [candidate division WOR-3 bacterium]